MINLEIPEHAYFFGFVQGDGHLSEQTRNRGKLTIELCADDLILLEIFQTLFPIHSSISSRIRNTNFKDNYTSNTLNFFNREFRTQLKKLGLPVGKKSDNIKPPIVLFSKVDYMRGLIDADGSLGITSLGLPFISFCTKSTQIANFYKQFLQDEFTITNTTNRNKRDNIYNIMNNSMPSVLIINKLYTNNSISLPRKQQKADEIISKFMSNN